MTGRKLSAHEVLPTSPLRVVCPLCKAKPDHDCSTGEGLFAEIHVARIKAAARADKKKAREV